MIGDVRLVVMGPSGCGKTTIGRALSTRLRLPFVDGDDLHPIANTTKMASGVPLDDDDRGPWHARVAAVLRDAEQGVVVACSALRRRYRDEILSVAPAVRFLELRVPQERLTQRMADREHFMPTALLGSQLSTWEPLGSDEPGWSLDADGDIDAVIGDAFTVVGIERSPTSVAVTRASVGELPRNEDRGLSGP